MCQSRRPARRWATAKTIAAFALIVCAGCSSQAPPGDQPVYDLVLSGGRVMDPESGLDAVRDVGIRDGAIAAI
jgi:hypothetical protein